MHLPSCNSSSNTGCASWHAAWLHLNQSLLGISDCLSKELSSAAWFRSKRGGAEHGLKGLRNLVVWSNAGLINMLNPVQPCL